MLTRPDNSIYPSTIIGSDIDNAELAARLGFNRFRRTGRMILADDFHISDNWALQGVGSTKKIYTTLANNIYLLPITPPGMLYLNSIDGGIRRSFPIISPSIYGLELTFGIPSIAGMLQPDYIDFSIKTYNLETILRFDLTIYPHQWKQWVNDLGGSWVILASETSTFGVWFNIKIILDQVNVNLPRTLINKNRYINIGSPIGTGGLDENNIQINITNPHVNPSGIMIDNVIVTMEENG